MKITAFNASPRGERGNTHVMVSVFLEGAKRAGADVENILLVKNNIKHCMGCFTCWTQTPGVCAIKDDMPGLLEEYIKSDIVIIATPLYVDYVSGIMKDFMDRMLPIVCPQFEKDDTGQTRHKKRYNKYPAMIMMSNCGFPEAGQFEVLRLYCERRARNNKTDVLAQIYRSQGPLFESDDPDMKPVVEKYKELLRNAGEEVVKYGQISSKTQEELEKPLIPEDEYSRAINESWGKL
ncbi:MAG: flavodoxin family protein [Candidatus Omnitrophota bacterium]